MTELRERFRSLDDLGSPPDVWAQAMQRGPQPSKRPALPLRRRVGVAALALVMSAAAIGLVVRAFTGGPKVTRVPTASWSVTTTGPTQAGVPYRTTAITVSRQAVWVAYFDSSGGHLARLDPESLETVAVIDGVPTTLWETGGGGLAAMGDKVWIGGDNRLVAVDERTNQIVVDRQLDGCCADVAVGGVGFYAYANDASTRGGVLYAINPETGRTYSETRIPGLRPRRAVEITPYVGVVGWETTGDGGIVGADVIAVHFEGMPPVVDGPLVPVGSTVTSSGWTAGSDGGLDQLDATNLLKPIAHVDLPIGRIDAVTDGPRGLWVIGHDGSMLVVGGDDMHVLMRFQAPAGAGWNAVAAMRDTVYLLGLDGRVTAVSLRR